MALSRLSLKSSIKSSHVRLLSPLSKSMEISTCTNKPKMKECNKSKQLLQNSEKKSAFLQRGRVRYQSYKNQKNDKVIKPSLIGLNLKKSFNTGSTPLLNSIEDHLQPLITVVSDDAAKDSIAVLEAQKKPSNKYLAYIQRQNAKLRINSPPKSNFVLNKKISQNKDPVLNHYDKLNTIIQTEKDKRREQFGFEGHESPDILCILDIYDAVKNFKRRNPNYKSKFFNFSKKRQKINNALEEIIKFLEQIQGKVSPKKKNEFEMTNTENFNNQEYKENYAPFLTNINRNSRRLEPPYSSYSEVIKVKSKSSSQFSSKYKEKIPNTSLFNSLNVKITDQNLSPNLSQQYNQYSQDCHSNRIKSRSVKIHKIDSQPSSTWDKCGKISKNNKCQSEKKKEEEEECLCVQPVNPECKPICQEIPTIAPPLKRLKKVDIKEPPKICPQPTCDETIRADNNLKIQRKKLPKFKPSSCPCIEKFVPSVNVPLKRLTPKYTPKMPKRECPVERCPPRADDNLKVVSKSLPELVPSACPCVELNVPSKAPSLKRLNFKFVEPSRVCDPCKTEPCCPPRMDDGLEVKKRKLPPMKPSSCPCFEPKIPSLNPSLKRLGPVNIPEPAKISPVEPCPPSMDKHYKIEKKKLPILKDSNCPPPCIEPPTSTPILKRLKQVTIAEPPKICPVETCDDNVRADDNYKIKPRKLPYLKASSCPCIEPFVPCVNVPLKRLKAIPIPEPPEKYCEPERCPPRADDNLQIFPKNLPSLPDSSCKCIEPKLPSKSPRLKRLNIKFIEPPRICDPCKVEVCCPPRLDDGMKIEKKKLPHLKHSDCPCVELDIPSKMPSLKRLGPVNILEPPKICPVEECPPSMDRYYKIEKKLLPKLTPSSCPPPCLEGPSIAPPIKRLKKVDIPEPPKECPVETCEDKERADDNYKIQHKPLPKMAPSSCPCVEPFIPSVNVPLKRLKQINIEVPERICIVEQCPPRADDNLKVYIKKLPPLPLETCPCVEPNIPSKNPPLKRLNIKFLEPPRICDPCKIEVCCPPRLDEGLEIKKRQLPNLEPSLCPCVEPFIPDKSPSLKRLGPINLVEPPKVCPVEECPPPKEIVIKKKTLPILKDSNCPAPCIEVPNLTPKLKRLNKTIPEPPKICPVETCEDQVRADDNYKIKPMKLPPLPKETCPCIEPFIPSVNVPLKRLTPCNQPIEKPKICVEEVCPPRADDNLKIVSKCLPPLGVGSCPCVEPHIPTKAPNLKRLNIKFPEPPRFQECKVETCDRIDERYIVVKKKLPSLKDSDCPCVEPEIPSKAPSLKRLGPINLTDPPKVCHMEECPPTLDEIVGHKVEKKKLKTLILNECHNTMSTKEFNERKEGKLQIPKRKYGTLNFSSKNCRSIFSTFSKDYSSFSQNSYDVIGCDPYALSANVSPMDEDKEKESLIKSNEDITEGVDNMFQKIKNVMRSIFVELSKISKNNIEMNTDLTCNDIINLDYPRFNKIGTTVQNNFSQTIEDQRQNLILNVKCPGKKIKISYKCRKLTTKNKQNRKHVQHDKKKQITFHRNSNQKIQASRDKDIVESSNKLCSSSSEPNSQKLVEHRLISDSAQKILDLLDKNSITMYKSKHKNINKENQKKKSVKKMRFSKIQRSKYCQASKVKKGCREILKQHRKQKNNDKNSTENILGSVQSLLKTTINESNNDDTVRLKAFFVLEAMQKLKASLKIVNGEPKFDDTCEEDDIQNQSIFLSNNGKICILGKYTMSYGV